jgi:hypothetical protein
MLNMMACLMARILPGHCHQMPAEAVQGMSLSSTMRGGSDSKRRALVTVLARKVVQPATVKSRGPSYQAPTPPTRLKQLQIWIASPAAAWIASPAAAVGCFRRRSLLGCGEKSQRRTLRGATAPSWRPRSFWPSWCVGEDLLMRTDWQRPLQFMLPKFLSAKTARLRTRARYGPNIWRHFC